MTKKSSWPPVILIEKKEKKHFSKIRLREIDAITLIPPTVSQNFQYETHAVTGNENYVNLLQLVILTENKKRRKLYAVALFASH